jgi:glutamine---fructose-6-phosphate transaminase (isomerizing)
MCGIIGYLGKNEALPILVDGLKRLEYRGYDSSGVAVQDNGEIITVKAVGKIKELDKKIEGLEINGNAGIAHTRWATHGKPSEENAHPHSGCKGDLWLVHNGIIENYIELKKHLEEKGHKFLSETDTEVISHLIEDFYEGDLEKAFQKTLKLLKGTYGIALMHADHPGKILAARKGSPLVIGLGEGETIIASDVSAIVRYTKQVIYLDDGEIASINGDGFKIFNFDYKEINKEVTEIEWDAEKIEKEGFPHFMLKEIFEQPETIINSTRGRLIASDGKVKLGGLEGVADRLREIDRVVIVACGTAYTAGLVGEYMLEEYAGIPVEVEYASEFRYRKPILGKHTAVLAISQSGETADTLAAIREAKEKGILTLGIINSVGSTIAREVDAGIYNHAGPEISVASTKAFTSQVTVIALLTVFLGRQRQMSLVTGKRIIEEILSLPEKIKIILDKNDLEPIAKEYFQVKNFAFMGRKYNSPLALEGAIKLKELSYIHAEGFPSGEMKHGPIAMIDEDFPSIFIAPRDSVYEKNISNIEEIRSRSGKIITIATEGDEDIKRVSDQVIYIPKTLEMLTPILAVIPLQLFAYHMAILNDRDVDKPRNLAKSVTVE